MGKFLIFDCTQKECAGYGNRVQSITSLLIVAMLTKHVFLIDAPDPVNLSNYLLPNAIQWNYTLPKGLKSHFVNLFSMFRNFKLLENVVFHPDQQDIVRVRTYFGTIYFYELMSEQFVDKILSTFKLKPSMISTCCMVVHLIICLNMNLESTMSSSQCRKNITWRQGSL